jgi:hypothetical protein
MSIKRKVFLGTIKLGFDYVEDEDTKVYDQDDVRWEMTSWLEDLGFVVDYVDVVENRRV